MMKIETLKRRAEIVRGIRRFFDERGFLEVETPVRIAAPAPECHIDCPPVATGGYLRASPELEMKALLAAGMEKIYQIGPCFRDGEKGSRHNPEFTMIEWYRLGADYRAILEDTKNLYRTLKGGAVEFTELTVRDAYLKYAGWNPWTDFDADRFDYDMAVKIEPALKDLGATFLIDYPPECASLARLRRNPDGLKVAERWEFYVDGMELANCFSELCDPSEQRRRFAAAKAERKTLGEADYPLNEDFFAALESIESAAGVALGVDRLVMTLTGERRIDEVRIV